MKKSHGIEGLHDVCGVAMRRLAFFRLGAIAMIQDGRDLAGDVDRASFKMGVCRWKIPAGNISLLDLSSTLMTYCNKKIEEVRLMEEILHHLICSLSYYLQGFIHPRWLFRISSINSMKGKVLIPTVHALDGWS